MLHLSWWLLHWRTRRLNRSSRLWSWPSWLRRIAWLAWWLKMLWWRIARCSSVVRLWHSRVMLPLLLHWLVWWSHGTPHLHWPLIALLLWWWRLLLELWLRMLCHWRPHW